MDTKTSVRLREWNAESNQVEETGEVIGTYTLAKSMSIENFAALLDEFLNLGGKGFREGRQVGLELRFTHRTLQRLAIGFAFGLIVGLSEQEYTDPRNETAIQTAKKIAGMLEHDELPLGSYI